MDQDRPLTSEEMIRRARADLEQRHVVQPPALDRERIAAALEDEPEPASPTPRRTVSALPEQQKPRRPQRIARPTSRRPDDGFGEWEPSNRAGLRAAIALGLVLAGFIGFLRAAFSSVG